MKGLIRLKEAFLVVIVTLWMVGLLAKALFFCLVTQLFHRICSLFHISNRRRRVER